MKDKSLKSNDQEETETSQASTVEEKILSNNDSDNYANEKVCAESKLEVNFQNQENSEKLFHKVQEFNR